MLRTVSAILVTLFCCCAAAAQTSPPTVVLPPAIPPIIAASGPTSAFAQRLLLKWVPGEARCQGVTIRPEMLRPPQATLGYPPGTNAVREVAYGFRIDATGRPLSIEALKSIYVPGAEDIGPALSTSRFPAGARSGCEITYAMQLTPLADAPIADLIAYSIAPSAGPLPRETFDRIIAAGHACMEAPRPGVLQRNFPDFLALPGTPGAMDWSMVQYDLDARGRPVHAKTLFTTGNGRLDAASLKAVSESRFTPGARAACLYPYWRAAETLPAPAIPDPDTFPPNRTTCPDVPWASPPKLIFPPAYQRRAIEGWAIVGYDVAPWGATGNVRVLAAEPAADFGTQAQMMISTARRPASERGASGCVARVRFVMPARDKAVAAPADGF
jgi:hypothetical protein